MNTLRVEVTAEDIALGKPGDPFSCPVALAVRRASGVVNVGVGRLTARVRDTVYNLPHYVTDWIDAYDISLVAQPEGIGFTLEQGDATR